MTHSTARLRRNATLLVLAGALLVTGCRGGESTAGSAGAGSAIPDTAAIVNAVQSDPALAGEVPAAIKGKGTLSVGSNVQSPPNNFYGADGKKAVGFEVDLITAAAKKLGLGIAYSDMSFDSLITSLQTGRIDATIAGMNDTKERQQKIDFVDYFTSGITMMVGKGNPEKIHTVNDLCGKAIAVVTGTSQQEFAKAQSAQCTAAGKPALAITDTSSDSQNQQQLRSGRIAVILNDLPSAVYISRTAGDGKFFETVDQPPLNGGPYGIGLSKENKALTQALQKALQSLVDDGTYTKILDAWQITSGALQQVTVNAG
ncbi:ABC transporter substrate-binding protein [Nocardia sp. NPDC049149]|uniref:ABC transporter substrate-binding protein n=1 Tax=Nocardia sp. NPDC049149 TaxID=3364315 RepID=UPI00371B1436